MFALVVVIYVLACFPHTYIKSIFALNSINTENNDKDKLSEQKLLVEENFAKLLEATENRKTLLKDAASAADYIENNNDSKDWINVLETCILFF